MASLLPNFMLISVASLYCFFLFSFYHHLLNHSILLGTLHTPGSLTAIPFESSPWLLLSLYSTSKCKKEMEKMNGVELTIRKVKDRW
jgi:hypothetical protein